MTAINERPATLTESVEPLEPAPQGGQTQESEEQEPQRPETDHARPADQAGQRIDVLRNQIDAVDDAIIRLIGERVSLSKNVGTLRRAGGGPRLSLHRENQIIGKFGRALGTPGTPLAMLLLKISRGRM